MKDLNLSVTINKPAAYIFDFTLDPANTPKWIDLIVTEEANERPPKLGTIYRNQDTNGEWNELELTAFDPPHMFVLSSHKGYHVSYTFQPVDADVTRLDYREWVDSGELKPFSQEALNKLKVVIEAEAA